VTRAKDRIPESLDTPEFRAAWQRWLDYRRDVRRKPVSPQAAESTLQNLALWGRRKAMRAIEEAMRNDWQSIHQPTGKQPFSGESICQILAKSIDDESKADVIEVEGVVMPDPPQQAAEPATDIATAQTAIATQKWEPPRRPPMTPEFRARAERLARKLRISADAS
jgi:hypothetical protein